MIYGYARVSTAGQAKDGNSLEAQEKALKENGAVKIYMDAYTGTKKHRPELDRLMRVLKSGDTLVVTKLDRIARSTVHGTQIVGELLDRDIRINVLNMGVMDNTPNGKLIRTIFFAFAEFERDMIIERTQEGKEVARQKPGYKEGRKVLVVPEFDEYYNWVKSGKMKVKDAVEELGISRASWYNLVKEAV